MRELKAGTSLAFDTLWGWLYFFLILLIWIIAMFVSHIIDIREPVKHAWFIYIIIILWSVLGGASLLGQGYRSVLGCGGLYCVPRLTRGMKRFSIIAGFILAFMFTLPWFLVKNLTLQETYICMSISFTLLTAYFTGTSIPWPTKSKSIVSLLTLALWAAIIVRIIFVFYPGISLFKDWPITLAAGIFLCAIYCGPYKDKQIQNAHRQLACLTTNVNEPPQQAKMRITPGVERFFISRLTQCSQKHKYLWGAIYPCIGLLLSSRRRTLLIPLALAIIIMCYFLPTPSMDDIVLFITVIIISGIGYYIKLPVHSQMLVAGGRRERYYGTIAAAVGFSITVELILVVIMGISWLTAPIIPPYTFSGQTITFTPLSPYLAFVAMGIIPVIFGLSLCYERAPWLTCFVAFLMLTLAFALSSLIANDVTVGPVPIMLIVVSCWAFLILTAWIICHRMDLILQTDKI